MEEIAAQGRAGTTVQSRKNRINSKDEEKRKEERVIQKDTTACNPAMG